MKFLSTFFLLVIVSASQTALAARPTYNFLGLGYIRQDLHAGNDCVQDGLYLEGSLAMDEHFFVAARHVDVTSDEWHCGSTTTRISGGFKADVGRASSFYSFATGMIHDSGNDTDPGLGMEMGLRSFWQRGLESQFFIGYEVVDDFDESYIGAGLNYWFARHWSLNAQATFTNEDTTGLSLGIRFNM